MADWNLQQVVEAFDKAAIDPGAWTTALDILGERVGAHGALLISTDLRLPGAPVSASLAPMMDEYFRDGWNAQDVRFRGVPVALRKGIAIDHDFLSVDEMNHLPFYQEWLAKHRFRYFASLGIPSGDGLVFLSIQRTIRQGMFEPNETRKLLSLLKPLSDAAALSRQFGQSYVLGMADALQFTSSAAMLLDKTGRVLEVNALCVAMLGNGVDVKQQRLHIRDRLSRDGVDALLRTAMSSVAVNGAQDSIVITNDVGRRIQIRAIALRDWAKTTFTDASVMLLIEPAPGSSAGGPTSLAAAFGLTPTETRLCLIMREGLSTAEAAERIGIRYSTARTHLKSIMHKTDTRRQGQLMALLTKYQA